MPQDQVSVRPDGCFGPGQRIAAQADQVLYRLVEHGQPRAVVGLDLHTPPIRHHLRH